MDACTDACACQGYYKQMKQQAVVKGIQLTWYRLEKKNLERLWAKEFAQMLIALSSSLLPCPQQGFWAVYSKWGSRATNSGHRSVSAGQSKEALLLWLHSMKAVTFTEQAPNQLCMNVIVVLYQVSTAQDFSLKACWELEALTVALASI